MARRRPGDSHHEPPRLTIIHDVHGAVSAMLRSITLRRTGHRKRGSWPDFAVRRAMLFYVDAFPEKLHHTKESQWLFPTLRQRSAEAAVVLDRLDREPRSCKTATAGWR